MIVVTMPLTELTRATQFLQAHFGRDTYLTFSGSGEVKLQSPNSNTPTLLRFPDFAALLEYVRAYSNNYDSMLG